MSGIVLDRVSKRFKGVPALDAVTLDVASGETLAVFGPSGGGKTVLLRLISGVHDPDEGRILIDGADMTDVPPEHRGVGMAFQNFALFPHMSARDNIGSPLHARGLETRSIREKVGRIAQLLKIEHVLDHSPRELSNGQKQRTALARALVAGPRVLLLDDPLRNVDAKLRFEMRLELPRLLRQFGSTVLYVTQDYKEAMALGQRIAVLISGRIVQCAEPETVYSDPETLEVARAFGDPTVNLIEADVHMNGRGPIVALDNASIVLGTGYGNIGGRAVTLGIRPESLAPCPPDAENAVPVEVVAVTPVNERSVLLLATASGRELLASRPAQAQPIPAGSRICVRFDPAHLMLFDRESGSRIRPLAS
jgi:multiple sugar transport system ATP-binding protein